MESFYPPPARPYSAYAPIRARARRQQPAEPGLRTGSFGSNLVASGEAEAEIARIARQLALVARQIPWERVQNDTWDRLSPYIFRIRTAARVRARSEAVAAERGFDRSAFVHYAMRRWYCFWGSRIAEALFVQHPGVAPGPPKDRVVDFTIDGVPFDLKTSDVPRAFAHRLGDLHTQPEQVATWLYAHQSREGRFHCANRLFLILCDALHPEESWRLRADVGALRGAIDLFLKRRKYVEIWVPDEFGTRRRVVTGVIPVSAATGPRQLTLAMPLGSPDVRPAVDPPEDEPVDYQLGLPLS